jgi:hypothetical protein
MGNVYGRQKAFLTVPGTVENLETSKAKNLQPSKWSRIAEYESTNAILMFHLPNRGAQNSHHTNATYKRFSNPGWWTSNTL